MEAGEGGGADSASGGTSVAPNLYSGNVAGNYYDKYGTRNPIARLLTRGFVRAVARLARESGARQVLEIGCGEGHLAVRLAREGLTVRGIDVTAEIIEAARTNARAAGVSVRFDVAGIDDLDPGRDGAELVLCCEVLEHLPDPAAALRAIARLARPHALLSVPREPVWRALNLARGKYWRDRGNTPGHIQHWSARGFLAFASRELRPVSVLQPFPWTVVLCRND